MHRNLIISFGLISFFSGIVTGEPSSAPRVLPSQKIVVQDPRFSPPLQLLYNNQRVSVSYQGDALLVYAMAIHANDNQIIGVDGSFTDGQILAALRKFYLGWRPPSENTYYPRPNLIIAQREWGCGARLYEPLKAISAEFEIDVYLLPAVLGEFETSSRHPTKNDMRLSELLKSPETKPSTTPRSR